MKKIIILLMLCVLFFTANTNYVFCEDFSLNPIIKAINGEEKAYVDEYYAFTFEIENLLAVNNCEIILRYNTDVLQYEELYGVDEGLCDYYCTSDLIKEGEVSFRVYYSGDCNGECTHESIQYRPGISFKVIDEGNTDFQIEIIENDCKGESRVRVDISELKTESELDNSEIFVSYNEDIVTISGHGRVTKDLRAYDVQNTIPEDTSLIKGIVVEDGITEIRKCLDWSYYESLKNIWYPDSLYITEFPSYSKRDEDVIIHANGMTYAEAYASTYNLLFELNEGFTIGDLDSNGAFDADDALKILKMAAKLDTLYKWSADADGNGTVNASDALTVLKRAAKLL